MTDGRMQVIMANRPAAGYFVLQNNSDAPLSLTGASAPHCGMLMLHQSTHQGGVERMTMVDSVKVPAHGSVRFAPGGYHLMCDDPSGPLLTRKGTEPVTLEFADGTKVQAPFTVGGPGK